MPLRIFRDADADPSLLSGRTVAVIGYGNQGRAQALNLRDSGVNVVVGQRAGGPNWRRALDDGFEAMPAGAAAARAGIVHLLLPDEKHVEVFRAELAEWIKPGMALVFSHGFSVHFGGLAAPAGVDVIMVSPKGPGTLVRQAYVGGGGVPALVAVHQDASGRALDLAVAYAAAIGAGKRAIIETTFREECETDLFGEQAVLCGGALELMKSAWEVLVEAGYPPELAYIECIHELKQVVDLVYTEGLSGMCRRISDTAEYGAYTRGPRIVTDETRAEMRRILGEIRDGRFARDWMVENAVGRPHFNARRRQIAESDADECGRDTRRILGM